LENAIARILARRFSLKPPLKGRNRLSAVLLDFLFRATPRGFAQALHNLSVSGHDHFRPEFSRFAMKRKKSRPKKVPKLLPKTIEELGSFAKVEEVAAILRISPTQVGFLIDEGQLAAIDISTPGHHKKSYRIFRDSLKQFVDSSKRRAGLA
jgi:Helix-turn-helix domain